ncbi:MAG: hypothetical protein ABSE58_03600 [Candidatus Limnocylindrales bacterium]|jgi:hypothetical protein
MASWRCPHCGSPQLEAARCWVCRRSTTSCASCRHFRTAIAGRLGYCALDKHREPLTGEEERACWERLPAEAIADSVGTEGVAVEPAAARGGGLWGTAPAAEAPVDRDARGHGLWTEPALVSESDDGHEQHAGTVRSRPWGPVPGLHDDAGWHRGIRTAKPKR